MRGGAFFNGKEGRDDFRTPFLKGKEGRVGFRKNTFFNGKEVWVRFRKKSFFLKRAREFRKQPSFPFKNS